MRFTNSKIIPALVLASAVLLQAPAMAQAPAEVQNVVIDPAALMSWDPAAGADIYHVYRASRSGAGPMGSLRCHAYAETQTSRDVSGAQEIPADGSAFIYVVTAESTASGEGPPGSTTLGATRHLEGACTPMIRTHAFQRAGYGWSEWSRDRLLALGSLDAYINEQLNPSTISEADNNIMHFNLARHFPLVDAISLIARDIIYATHARRQLEHRMTVFWMNHFNTDYAKLLDHFDDIFPGLTQANKAAVGTVFRDWENFQDLAFNGNFRQMLEAGTFSSAMLIYLDLIQSVAGAPNENQPRELMELHSMSVNGGYTQLDIEELSRVMTGWIVCKHETADADDPLAACIADPTSASPPGEWVPHFDITRHDCGAKTLFAGTPQELILPGTAGCSSVADANAALAEMDQVLDTIAAHPSTADFISTKLLQLLVTDNPTQAMVDQLVAVWNDPGNPNGVGDLREVTREALTGFLDPAFVGTKIKTPFEYFTGIMHSLRGQTDGLDTVFAYLAESQHLPYFNEVPTGYAEIGVEWVSTGGMLAQQNFAIEAALADGSQFGTFGTSPDFLVGANVNINDPEAVVDFLAEILLSGRLTAVERDRAIEFLTTNDSGQPGSSFDAVRKATAFLLGYPQGMEQ